jgi:hypothetical protein
MHRKSNSAPPKIKTMKTTIKTQNDQGEAREIVLCDEIHNQGVFIYAGDAQDSFDRYDSGAEFLAKFPETVELSDDQIDQIKKFAPLAE